jgi:gas vesicle protein
VGSGSDEVDEIRKQIDQSRENLGHAVGGLAYKADVKNRGKEVVADKKEQVMDKVDEIKDKLPTGEQLKDKLPTGGGGDSQGGLGDKVKAKLPDAESLKDKLPDGAPSSDDVKDKAHGIAKVAAEHPAAIAGGAAIAGLAAGLALPETQLERDKLKPHAQQARADVTDRVQDTVQQVKTGVQDAAGSVTDAVKQQGQQQGDKIGEITEKAANKTQDQISGS